MTKQSSAEVSTFPELVPATVSAAGELELIASRLVEAARGEGIALTGEGGLLPALVARVLETGLGAELTEHLGYDRHSPQGYGSGNSRNGFFTKTIGTEVGPVEVRVPRDRNGTFEPELVPHGTRRLDGLSEQVISLYAQGLTTGEIQAHLEEVFGTQISKDTISRITDAIVADMEAWQSRPLDALYAVVLIDAIVIKVRGSQVSNRPVYVAIGVNRTANVTCWACGSDRPAARVPSNGPRCSPSSATVASPTC